MKKPEIRFHGYTEDWEQRKVKELCSISTGKSNTQDKIDDGEYPFYVRSAIVEHSKKYLYDEEAVLTVGDGVGTGKVFHYVNGKYDLHQRCYRMFDFSEDLNAKYFYHIFSKMFYKRVMAMTAKTSVDSVRLEMIADMEIPVPMVNEQEKIGAYFFYLDTLITLHQRKCDETKKMKKFMLQKMFPQDGAKIPEIRFEGFTEDWEQRKLGEICSEMFAGGDVDKTKLIEQGKYPVLANALTNDGIVGFYESEYRVKAPAVTITGRGDVGHAKARKVDFTPAVRLLAIRTEHDVDFIENAINTLKIVIESTGVPQLTIPQLEKYELFLPPTIKEEKTIGLYFVHLDHLITLHQHKCDELKKMKKFMLQKMFV